LNFFYFNLLNLVITEIESNGLIEEHEMQLNHYLSARTVEVGLERKVFLNEYKTTLNA
jgi:hypothetical protein